MGDDSTTLNDPTTLRESIAWHMGEVLARPPLEPADDFFLCGGDSLLAVQLISRLIDSHRPAEQGAAEQLESALLMAVFDDATPDGLAKIIAPQPS
jgi:hypothetical protein